MTEPAAKSPKTQTIRKAVFPAAGLGTRFLPATKAQPKEMLPLVDKPIIQYGVEEAVASGVDNIILVTGRGKNAIEDHFDVSVELETFLEARGKKDQLAEIRGISSAFNLSYVRQGEPLGLGHAVGTAASHVGDNAFAVLLGDEFVEEDKPLLPAMLELQARTGGIVLAFMEVKPEETSRYGIAVVEPSDLGEDVVKVTGLVEKPAPEDAPSNLAVLGRYILPGSIFDAIADTKPGSGGEIQLTDAMAQLLADGVPVHGIVYRGHRYDTGMPLGYLQAVVMLASKRADLGEEFREWLAEFVAGGAKG